VTPRSEDLASRLAKAGSRTSATPRPPATAANPAASASGVPMPKGTSVRTKTVRITTDLSPRDYRELVNFCLEAAGDTAVARVPHSVVIRLLLERLSRDRTLRLELVEQVRAAVT
jgi:hypothetical protein